MNAYTDDCTDPLVEEPNDVPITRADMSPGHGQMREEATEEDLRAMGFSEEWIEDWKRRQER